MANGQQNHPAVQSVAVGLLLCSLLPATSHFNVLIGQKMLFTGWSNCNDMRNAICVDTHTYIDWPYCPYIVAIA